MLKSVVQKILGTSDEPDLMMLVSLEKNASRVLHLTVSKSLSELKITPTEWIILAEVQKTELGLNPLILSEILNLKPSFIASYLKKFEKKGYIKLLTNPKDKRFKTVQLTNKGVEVFKKGAHGVELAISNLFEGVSAKDVEGFMNVLSHITTNK